MEFVGSIADITRDFFSKTIRVSFTFSEGDLAGLSALKESEVKVTVGKNRKKRSLDANAYCWVLITKLAEVLDTSKEELYEELLQKYGYLFKDENGEYVTITVKASVDMNRIDGHWLYYRTSGDLKWKSYFLIKGSSKYDTKEMAHFIDMIIGECKEQGIETIPNEELERMLRHWEKRTAS